MKKEISSKRRFIGRCALGVLLLSMLFVLIFNSITGFSRSAGDSPFTEEYRQKLREELIKKGLPTSQKEGRERDGQPPI